MLKVSQFFLMESLESFDLYLMTQQRGTSAPASYAFLSPAGNPTVALFIC